MAAARRLGIPQAITDELLFASDHTCCICRTRGKDVQIHHIDGNPKNNDSANLAVVCLDCHSRISGKHGLGKSYSRGEVRRYKRAWDRSIQESKGIHRPRIAYRKELVSQVDLIICEILALRANSPRVRELLSVLYELHLWRGSHQVDRAIVDGLHHLALMSGLSSPRVAALVAEKLWQMCWHFAGPKHVSMDSRDEDQVARCIEALETLTTFNCEFGHGRKAASQIANSAESFFEVALWYSRRRLANAVLEAYEQGIAACAPDGRVKFHGGYVVLRRSLHKLESLLAEERPSWRLQSRRLEKILRPPSANTRFEPTARQKTPRRRSSVGVSRPAA